MKNIIILFAFILMVSCGEYKKTQVPETIPTKSSETNLQNTPLVAHTVPELVECASGGYKIYFTYQGQTTVIGDPVYVCNGTNGNDGSNGNDGTDGINGLDGTNGTNGKDGVDGNSGKDGVDGSNGKDGLDGADGENGKDGKSTSIRVKRDYPENDLCEIGLIVDESEEVCLVYKSTQVTPPVVTTPVTSATCEMVKIHNYAHSDHFEMKVSGLTESEKSSLEIRFKVSNHNSIDSVGNNNGGSGFLSGNGSYYFSPINKQTTILFYINGDGNFNLAQASIVVGDEEITCSK